MSEILVIKVIESSENLMIIRDIALVLLGIFATIISNIFYKWYIRPINLIKKPKIINGKSGKFYLIPIKNKGKSASKNCTSRIFLQGKLNNKDIVIETLLSWSPTLHKGFTDINVKDERNVDLCFNPKNSIIKFADYRGYNNFVKPKQKSDGKEIGEDIDMSKVKTLNGKFIVSSENSNPIEKKLIIKYENNIIKVLYND